MAVEAFQLGKIEPRRRASDLRQIKRGDHFLGGEDLLIAMGPAQSHQIIAQRHRQVTQRAIGIDAERAVTLARVSSRPARG